MDGNWSLDEYVGAIDEDTAEALDEIVRARREVRFEAHGERVEEIRSTLS